MQKIVQKLQTKTSDKISYLQLNNTFLPLDNDKERYETILEHAAKLITQSQLSVLKLGLSLHIYSPKVEMFGQIAAARDLPGCPIVADVGGKLTCDMTEMKEYITKVC